MTADRAEWTGIGAALTFHIALIALLSTRLASTDDVPEPPSMEVELVDDVALTAAAPTSVAEPPASEPTASQPAPSDPPPMPAAPLPTPVPAPLAPPPPSRPAPAPVARPVPQPQRPVARPTPQRPATRPAPRAPAQPTRRAGLGDDFLKNLDDDLAPRAGPSKPSAARFDAKAQASVASLIQRQIEPCARRQRHVSETAKSMSVVLGLAFLPSGQLRGRPTVVRVDGVNDDNAQFRDLAVDQAISSYRECSPLRLPPELYSTPQGGWKNIRIIFDVR